MSSVGPRYWVSNALHPSENDDMDVNGLAEFLLWNVVDSFFR